MNCKICGNKLSKHLTFCSHCGNPIADATPPVHDEPSISTETPRKIILDTPDKEYKAISNTIYPSNLSDSWIKSNRKVVILSGCGIVLLITAIFYFLNLNNSPIPNLSSEVYKAGDNKIPINSVSGDSDIQTPLQLPFYILNVAAFASEADAIKKVEFLKAQGHPSSHLWIPDYPSLSGAKMFSAFIGPFDSQHDCEVATENYRRTDPNAYGTLVSHEKKRVQINGIGKIVIDGNPSIEGNKNSFSSTCNKAASNGTEAILITGDNVRVRETPNSSGTSNILFKLGKEDTPLVIDKTTNQKGELWYKICYENFEGWVISQFAAPFIIDDNFRKMIENPSNHMTKVMKMTFQGYSEGDYPHLLFKDIQTGTEYDYRFIENNNYDDVKLLLTDNNASFGYKENPKYQNKMFLISCKKKNVLDSDLNGNSYKTQDWCITGIREVQN